MRSYCIPDPAANLLIRHMVFFRKCSEVSESIASQGLGSLFRVLLSKSSSRRHRGKVDKMSVNINVPLEATDMFLSLHMIFSLERAAVFWAILEKTSDLDPSLVSTACSL